MGKVTLMVMGLRGYTVLTSIIKRFGPAIIKGVISSRDHAVLDDCYENIKDCANSNKIPFFERGDEGSYRGLLQKDSILAVAWRWLIQETFKNQLVIAHDSLLPKYRGFAPVVNMLINGENKLGVTLLYAGKTCDTGDIISQKSVDIAYPIKISEAMNKVSALYVDLIIELLTKVSRGEPIIAVPQNDALASYSPWRNEDDYGIRFFKDSVYIKRFIDSVGSPYKGASATLFGERVRLLEAEVERDVVIEDRASHLGKILFVEVGKPVVICGSGLLRVLKLVSDKTEDLLPLGKMRGRFIGIEG